MSTNADDICEPPSSSNRIIAGGYISLMAPSSSGSEHCSLGSRMMAIMVPHVPFMTSPSVGQIDDDHDLHADCDLDAIRKCFGLPFIQFGDFQMHIVSERLSCSEVVVF